MTPRHQQTGNDGTGHYEARADVGQGIDMHTLKMMATVAPAVYWVPEEGAPIRAWQGQPYRAHPTSKRKSEQSVMFLAKQKRDVLRTYYKLNGRRWELVVDEERAERKAVKRAEAAARERLHNAAPQLHKQLTEAVGMLRAIAAGKSYDAKQFHERVMAMCGALDAAVEPVADEVAS